MIAVIGSPYLRMTDTGDVIAGGLAADVARAAASRGGRVELIGRIGDDPTGDEMVTALTRVGVGHVSVLRDAALRTPELSDQGSISGELPTLEPADIDLALRYLADFRVLVLAEPADADVLASVAAAAGWSEATLIVLAAPGAMDDPALPEGAIVIETTLGTDGAGDEDGTDGTDGLAALVGSLAARIDAGEAADTAFRSVTAEIGVTPASD